MPELIGAMTQLEVPARHASRPIDAEAVRRLLAKREKGLRPQLRDIAAATARHFSLRLADLRGAARRRPVLVARHVAMFLARQLTKESLQRIGEYFGGRDHTTVLHGCRKTEELLQTDPAIRQAVDQLCRKLQPQPGGSVVENMLGRSRCERRRFAVIDGPERPGRVLRYRLAREQPTIQPTGFPLENGGNRAAKGLPENPLVNCRGVTNIAGDRYNYYYVFKEI